MPKLSSPSGLSDRSTAAIHRELARRQREAQRIARKRDRLLAAAARLDQQIAALGGTGNGSVRRGRPGRSKRPPRSGPPLAAVLAQVMGSKTMTVGQAGEAAVKAGYRSSASPKAFRVMVNAALINSGKFKRVGRGEYTAK